MIDVMKNDLPTRRKPDKGKNCSQCCRRDQFPASATRHPQKAPLPSRHSVPSLDLHPSLSSPFKIAFIESSGRSRKLFRRRSSVEKKSEERRGRETRDVSSSSIQKNCPRHQVTRRPFKLDKGQRALFSPLISLALF